MANRYAEDIRRIVGIDKAKSSLGPAEARESIPGKRGIAYRTPDGRNTASLSGVTDLGAGAGGTPIPIVNDGSLDEGFKQSGNWIDPRDPVNSIKTSGDNSYDIEDLIDSTTGPWINDQVTSGLGAWENMTGGTLDSITGIKDCNTGNEIELYLHPEGPPPAEGFADNETLPPELVWEEGFIWINSNASGAVNNSNGAGGNLQEAADNLVGHEPDISSASDSLIDLDVGQSPDTATTGHDGWALYKSSTIGADPVYKYFTIYACPTGVDPGGTNPDQYCTSEPPDNQFEPADGKMTLRLEDGKFVSNPFEHPDDVIAEFESEDFSQIDFCFGAGGARTGTIRPAINGGHMIYETSGGAPSGVIKIYDSAGRMYAATDITGIQEYLPR